MTKPCQKRSSFHFSKRRRQNNGFLVVIRFSFFLRSSFWSTFNGWPLIWNGVNGEEGERKEGICSIFPTTTHVALFFLRNTSFKCPKGPSVSRRS